jgi:hypothetical protein
MWLNPTSYYENNLNDFEVGVSQANNKVKVQF